eukprot:758484-Hanusia_phi.AAC.3
MSEPTRGTRQGVFVQCFQIDNAELFCYRRIKCPPPVTRSHPISEVLNTLKRSINIGLDDKPVNGGMSRHCPDIKGRAV